MKDPAAEDLRSRTRKFGVRIARLCDSLPRTRSANVIAYQLLRSGTSPGAQYREAIRSRSNAELISKLESILQELDETAYWLELLIDCAILPPRRLEGLQQETNELIAIFVAAVKKLKSKPRR
jgi:four helix bundle protein